MLGRIASRLLGKLVSRRPGGAALSLPTDAEIRNGIRDRRVERFFNAGRLSGFEEEFGRWISTDERWSGTLADGRTVNFWTWQGRVLRSTLTIGGQDLRLPAEDHGWRPVRGDYLPGHFESCTTVRPVGPFVCR